MTSKDLTQYIGQKLEWQASTKVTVSVKILDARETFGRTDLLITPVSGQGEQWVSSESCKPQETK